MAAFSDDDNITGSLAPSALHLALASGQDRPTTRLIINNFSNY